ncbi:MAG: class II aldolase/adducin family protein [Christensenellales bacterium]
MDYILKKYEEQIIDFVAACHRIGELGYTPGTGGNLSYRVDNNVVLVTPSGMSKRFMKPECVCALDLQGNPIHLPVNRKPTSETPFHLAILRKRPDIISVAHCHSPILTGFSIAGSKILEQPFLPEGILKLGRVIFVPYQQPGSQELMAALEKVAQDSNAFLMENHGAILCYPGNIIDCVEHVEMMETLAKSVLIAHLLGNAKPLSLEQTEGFLNPLIEKGVKMPFSEGRCRQVSEMFLFEK